LLTIEYCKGRRVIKRETSAAAILASAYGSAMRRAAELRADKVRFFNVAGREIAVYPVPKIYQAKNT
jgi:hypothetical protein